MDNVKKVFMVAAFVMVVVTILLLVIGRYNRSRMDKLISVYNRIEISQERVLTEKILCSKFAYQKTKEMTSGKEIFVLYIYENPLINWFPQIIEIHYDKKERVVAKRIEID